MFGVVGMNAVFLKIKQIRAVFISGKRKEKKRKWKFKIAILLSPLLCSDVPIPIESNPS
jgi:hypothetical protein